MMSLAVTPSLNTPSTWIPKVRERFWSRHCVAMTCSTSLVPMPKASAPKAPWVDVWLSPQTMVLPGCVMPSSGPITWTIPLRGESRSYRGTPNSAQFRASMSTCRRAISSVMGRERLVVGTLWSIVA